MKKINAYVIFYPYYKRRNNTECNFISMISKKTIFLNQLDIEIILRSELTLIKITI